MGEQTRHDNTAVRLVARTRRDPDMVSCQPIASLFEEVERRGLDPSVLIRDLDRPLAFLRSRRNRVHWDEMRSIAERMPDHFTEPEIVDIGRCLINTEAERPFGLIARYTMSAGAFYRAVFAATSGWGRPMFPVFESSFVHLAPGSYEATVTLREGFDTSPTFFLLAKGNIIGMPEAIGSPPAEVEAEPIERGVRFRIRVQERPSRLARLRNRVTMPFRSKEIAEELLDAHESLRARYDALERAMIERETAAEALRESETRLRLMLESAEMAIWDLDVATETLAFDDVARSMLGLDEGVDTLSLASVMELVHEDDRPAVERSFLSALAGAPGGAARYRLVVDGAVRTIAVRGHVFADDDGRPARFLGVAEDLTEALQRVERDNLLARVVADSPFEVYVADVETRRFLDVNEVAQRNLGYSGDELREMTPADIAVLDGEDALARVVGPLLRGETDRAVGLVTHRRKDDSTYPVELRMHVGVADSRRVLVSIGIDLTDRRRAERERRELENQLWQVQKLEALGTLASGISHDFNNLLMAIAGYSELVAKALPDDSKEVAYLQRIRQATEQGKALSGQVLTFSRDGDRRREPTSLGPVVADAVDVLSASTSPTTPIVASIEAASCVVDADAGQIAQIVTNLGSNAAHASADAATAVEVKLEAVDLDDAEAEGFAGLHAGPHVRLTVTDRGHGMPREVFERAFDPFFTTKDLEGATGLGLAIVHGIVRAHDGAIDVESEPGVGTTVHVLLPCQGPAHAPVSVAGPADPDGTRRVLLVDDEHAVADLLVLGLEAMGFRVQMCRDGEAALAEFTRDPSFDVVVTDQTMPEMSGLELAGEIRRIRPEMPIVLISGLGMPTSDDQTLRRLGISEVLSKPFALDDLGAAVRRALRAGAAV